MLACIVEGHGEVKALPLLLRRLAYGEHRYDLHIPRPIRVPKSKIVRAAGTLDPQELARALKLALLKLGSRKNAAVLVLLDADDACPADLGPDLQHLASRTRPDVLTRVVLAKREYEAWLVAAIESLKRGGHLPADAAPHGDPESISDAKGYLSRQMGPRRSYSETVDQPAFTQALDLDEAASCPSFLKLRRDLARLLRHVYRAPGSDDRAVTP